MVYWNKKGEKKEYINVKIVKQESIQKQWWKKVSNVTNVKSVAASLFQQGRKERANKRR